MSNKTCNGCKYYITEMFHCQKNDVMAEAFHTCEDFEPKVITNGDKIIAGGMRAIAEVAKNRCQHCIYKNCDFDAVCFNVDCADGIEAWLNAPADCVKQNCKNDAQAYLCEADYTESEVENDNS